MDIRIRKKFSQRDLEIAFHEAAHAVTAEHFVPECVKQVSIDGCKCGCHGTGVEGEVNFHWMTWRVDHLATMYAASVPGQRMVSRWTTDRFEGDRSNLRAHPCWLSKRQERNALRRAERLVRKKQEDIRLVAHRLLLERVISGDQLREVLRG